MKNKLCDGLLDFIDRSPDCFHATQNAKKELLELGFEELSEASEWDIKKGGKYFVTRNSSSVIAFKVPLGEYRGFMICASHSDSPAFVIKDDPVKASGGYLKLDVEKYGGMIYSTWLDRPLSFAGRVVVRTEEGIETRLVNADRDLLVMPNVAIHLNRTVNDGYKYSPLTDLQPLFSAGGENADIKAYISELTGTEAEDTLGYDLSLYVRQKGTYIGVKDEFISSPRLDDLECAYVSLEAFKNAENKEKVCVYAMFDNEEVGSSTKQGAASDMLFSTLARINACFNIDVSQMSRYLAESFMVSADNAHAAHPNHPELSDGGRAPVMNGGVVIKFNANRKYTTDGISASVFREICKNCGAPVQNYANRADIAGGSTLGNISNEKLSLNTVDIGLAQLAMHSACETAGADDPENMFKALLGFYSAALSQRSDGSYEIKY
ncbi:MAG: M18 family aminopeptidase [Ruminococcaceae bacterium]|nr:M18 family aminopeptidase [Oscillospiraceae bacterium]